MATQLLVNVLNVTNLAGAGSITHAHGLRSGDLPVTPTQVLCDRASPIGVTALTDTTVTFTNASASPATANFRVEYDHSIHAIGATPVAWQGYVTPTSLPPSGPAGGDLDQQYPDPRVVGFASKPIDTSAPAANEYWRFDGTTWRHVAVSPGTPAAVYGSYSNTDGPITIPVTPLAPLVISYDTVEGQNGVSLVGGTRLTVGAAGVYEFAFSPQLIHAGGGASVISMWPRLNGTAPVPRTNSDVKLANNGDTLFLYIATILALNAGDYIEWLMSSSNAGPTTLNSFAGAGAGATARPLAPAVIAGVKLIGV